MKFQFRLSEQRDGDIIYWLNHTEDKTAEIKKAIREVIRKENAVNEMLAAMAKVPDDEEMLKQAVKDIKITQEMYKNCNTLDDVKRLIGWVYPGEKKKLLDKAWSMINDITMEEEKDDQIEANE